MKRSTFIALATGALAGLGVQMALAQPKPPDPIFRNATVTNSLAVGNDLSVGDDLTVTDSAAAASLTTPFVDGGVVVTPLLRVGTRASATKLTSDDATMTWTGPAIFTSSVNTTSGTLTTNGISVSAGQNIVLGAGSGFYMAGVADQRTAPTVTACSGGTAATITASNGSGAVQFDVGTACTSESTAVLTLPAATTGWVCSCSITTADRMIVQRTMPNASTTQVTLQHITISTGANTDFTDSADVACLCRGM